MNETDHQISLSTEQIGEVALLLAWKKRLKVAAAVMILAFTLAIGFGVFGMKSAALTFLLIGAGAALITFWHGYMLFVFSCPRCGKWPLWGITFDQCAKCGLPIAANQV